MRRKKPEPPKPAVPKLADHPVLDFINTLPLVEGRLLDCFRADADVLGWLVEAGFTNPAAKAPEGLLEAARTLRNALNWLVERRSAGTAAEPEELAVLNRLLAAAPAYEQLVPGGAGAYIVQKTRDRTTAEGLLAPLAEAAAELLVGGDFHLVRRCESPACVLWFYDRTKSHKRRWCSMETCGNRAKVTAFRKRDSLDNAMRREQRALRRIISRKRKALL